MIGVARAPGGRGRPWSLQLARLSVFAVAASLGVGATCRASLAERWIGPRSGAAGAIADGLVELSVNGQRFWAATGDTDLPLPLLLDSFEGRCGPGAPGPLAWLRAVTPENERPLDSPGLPEITERYPSVRAEDEEHGYVACLHLGGLRGAEVGERLADLAATGALRDSDAIQYLYARASARGSLFALTWSADPVDLRRLARSEGDAVGADLRGIPRPPGSRRILLAQAGTRGGQVATYLSRQGDRRELGLFYRAVLDRSGWEVLDPADPAPTALAATRGDRLIWIVFQPTASGLLTTIADAPSTRESRP